MIKVISTIIKKGMFIRWGVWKPDSVRKLSLKLKVKLKCKHRKKYQVSIWIWVWHYTPRIPSLMYLICLRGTIGKKDLLTVIFSEFLSIIEFLIPLIWMIRLGTISYTPRNGGLNKFRDLRSLCSQKKEN